METNSHLKYFLPPFFAFPSISFCLISFSPSCLITALLAALTSDHIVLVSLICTLSLYKSPLTEAT